MEETKPENAAQPQPSEGEYLCGDDVNNTVKHLYGEVIWVKLPEYPYWPAIVVDPAWLSASLAANLKLTKKKTQNRLVAHFYDDDNSSQVIGLKNICYPYGDFYNEYKSNKTVNPNHIKKAKALSELSRLERCQAYCPSITEADIQYMENCIICKKPIEDLDKADLRLNKGVPLHIHTDQHFKTKSYCRCSNPSCMSLYHKDCLHTDSNVCGICKKREERIPSTPTLETIEEDVREDPVDEEVIGDGEKNEPSGVKRHAPRSTRSPTYHEEEDEDVTDGRYQVKKKRIGVSKSSGSAKKEEHIVIDMKWMKGKEACGDVEQTIKELVMMLVTEIEMAEIPLLRILVERTRLLVVWFSSLPESQQKLLYHFVLFLRFHKYDRVVKYAADVEQLLDTKFSRHHSETDKADFIKDSSFYVENLPEQRKTNLASLLLLLNKPGCYLLCQQLENMAYALDTTLGEKYQKVFKEAYLLLRENDYKKRDVMSCLIRLQDVVKDLPQNTQVESKEEPNA